MSTTYEKIRSVPGVYDSSELPSQLVVNGGEIRTLSGHIPLLVDIPNGTVLTVTPRSSAVAACDKLQRLQEENLGLRIEAAVERSYDTVAAESVPEPACELPKSYDEWAGRKQAAPKFRAWTHDEVRLGAEVRLKGCAQKSRMILCAVTADGEVVSPGFNPDSLQFGWKGFSFEAMRDFFEWRHVGFETWLNCETEI